MFGSMLTGQLLSFFYRLSFLQTGVTLASFMVQGKLPTSKPLLTLIWVGFLGFRFELLSLSKTC